MTETEKTNTIDRKDFMKQVGLGFGAIMLMNCLQSCGETEIPDPNPTGNGDVLDFSIDITASGNTALQTKGGFLVVASKKVIIARTLNDTWIAVSSACTHEGTTVNYRSASNDFLCPNHGSTFSSVGAATKSPATSALKKYNVTFTANSNTVRVFG
ncbi:Rieske (2Fe-2S) protein [Lacihabitans sp. LS3-19]|uniref:QcrA and Rieske domain-containing protein n=1 Tax=Lacihabitans sp. LS3-19 TaxID=2487335 RepID=UPI0020CC13FD|nr:Rieske (2Fe-2S) protein [Lacihabitans sp. LS3-19]MCP9768713.1 Rieske (2Fe-2S) protein [Lacihabitans sp. LS3-19]